MADIGASKQTSSRNRCAVGIFARAPVPGETKTRLIPLLGAEGAARFYVASLLDTLDMVRSTRSPRVVFAAPLSGRPALRRLGVEEEILGQGGGSLGRRMQRALVRLLGTPGVDAAFLIGTDSPDLPPALLRDARRALERAPAVLAPATDGGYTLVGLRRDALSALGNRALFEGVPWSHPQTLEQTVSRLVELGIPPRLLSPWWDVDEPEDLNALASRLRWTRKLGHTAAPRTTVLLRELGF